MSSQTSDTTGLSASRSRSYAETNEENLLANISAVLGAFGIATIVLLPLWGSIPLSLAALVVGVLAHRRSESNGGAGFATAGIVLGGIGLAASVTVIMFLLLAQNTSIDTSVLTY